MDAACEVPFDHHSPAFASGWREVYDGLRAACPVQHSPAHGGFWVVTGYDEVRTALLDRETFLSGRDLDLGGRRVAGGVTIPTNPFRMGMMEMDGARARQLRRIVMPWFAAGAVAAYQPRLDQLVGWVLDRVTPAGAMDVVGDLANPLPALVTLDVLGLPLERWEVYADTLHAAACRRPGSARQVAALLADLGGIVEAHRADRSGAGGPLGALLDAEVDGIPLATGEVTEMLFMLLNGGVDTSTAVIAHLLSHLDRHPACRGALVAHPELIGGFVDDLLRHVTPGTGVARTVARPTELAGVTLEPGDRVLLALGGADNDPAVYPVPGEVRTEARQPPHLAFGAGAHGCIGAGLATAELVAVTRQVLSRIPDYRIDRAGVEAYPTAPLVSGYLRMPATYTPAPAAGTTAPVPPPRTTDA